MARMYVLCSILLLSLCQSPASQPQRFSIVAGRINGVLWRFRAFSSISDVSDGQDRGWNGLTGSKYMPMGECQHTPALARVHPTRGFRPIYQNFISCRNIYCLRSPSIERKPISSADCWLSVHVQISKSRSRVRSQNGPCFRAAARINPSMPNQSLAVEVAGDDG
jgi:hypothetical protein